MGFCSGVISTVTNSERCQCQLHLISKLRYDAALFFA